MLSIQQILKYIQYYTLVEFHATLKQVKATLLQIVPTNVYSYYEMLSFKPLSLKASLLRYPTQNYLILLRESAK